MFKKLSGAIIVTASLFSSGLQAKENITIRFPVEYAADLVVSKANLDFVDRIDKLSEGRIKARYSPNGATYKGNELLQAHLRGDAEMTTLIPAYWASISPRVQIFDLPYAFPSPELFDQIILDKDFVAEIYSEVESKGAKVLGILRNSYIIPGTRDKQLINPEDFQGIKIRGMGKVNTMIVNSLGANALSLNVTEVLPAIQQGLVDGTQTLMDVYAQYKYYDFLKHVTNTRYQLLYYPWTVNAKWWNSLSADDQKLIQQAVDESILENNKLLDKVIAESEQTLIDNGVTVVSLTENQEQAIAEKTAVVWDELESAIGKDLIEKFKEKRELIVKSTAN